MFNFDMEFAFKGESGKHRPEVVSDTLLLTIPPLREGSPYHVLESIEEINSYVEEPLRETVRSLYKKNIETTSSSANKNDVERKFASIGILYDQLSLENKAIADMLVKEKAADKEYFLFPPEVGEFAFSIETCKSFMRTKEYKVLNILLGVNGETTAGDIEEKFAIITKKFKDQSPEKTGK